MQLLFYIDILGFICYFITILIIYILDYFLQFLSIFKLYFTREFESTLLFYFYFTPSIFLSIFSDLNIYDSYFEPVLIHYLMLQKNKIHLK